MKFTLPKKLLLPIQLFVLASLLIGVFYSIHKIQPTYTDFTLITPSGKAEPTEFPFFKSSSESGYYRTYGKIILSPLSGTVYRITPDDEILGLNINNVPVDLSMIPAHEKRDYNKGFIYDLTPYLRTGENAIEIMYIDGGGKMGIMMSAVGSKSFATFLYVILFVISTLIAHQLFKLANIKMSIRVLFIGALLIRLMYFTVTPPDVRDHDLGDHFGYIEYLAENWLPPPVEQAVGGAFFHPPLYYYTGAVVHKITRWFEPFNKYASYRVSQLLSLFYSMGFVFFGLLIIDKLLSIYRNNADTSTEEVRSSTTWCNTYKNHHLFWIIGALFAFWPVSIIHSVRIGNDPMLYFLLTASLYFMMQWYFHDKKRHLLLASFIGAAAIVTKANGEILVAVLAVIGLYKMIKSREWKAYFKLAIIPCFVLFTAVAITVAPGLILKMQGKRDKLYIDNIDGLSHANIVGNTAANYFWFDAKVFVTEPFTDPYDDRMGRQFFWNYLGKTGLFGEFKYPALLSINTAVFSSFLAVLMLIYTIVGIYHMRKSDFKTLAPVLLSGFFLWAGVTYMRMTFPANIDFRYIVPILLTFCMLYAASIIQYERIGATRMANIGKTISVLFSLSGIIFILALL